MTTIEDPAPLQIHSRFEALRAQLDHACMQSGRAASAVTLLAVSKTQSADAVRAAFAAGQKVFGENYIQEAVAKMAALQDLPIEWHCIGPVQANKTRLVAEHFAWIHSVDRLKIAQRLSEQRPSHLPALQVCLQVNIDGGTTKAGVLPSAAIELARQVVALPHLCLRGIMTLPEPCADYADQIKVHGAAKALFDAMRDTLPNQNTGFDTLSMGMSNDMGAAVHAGSTLVRIGTALFGQRER
jgi:pyridoxal phosphate enzyme (YggS family)